MINHLQRLQAEFENYQKRTASRYQRITNLANKELIKKILPILDNFALAFQNKKGEDFVKGVEMIFANFYSILEEAGLKKIDCQNKFNPYKHEVLLTEESDKENDTILQELQTGYILNEEVIRPAKVKIAKSCSKNKIEEENKERNEKIKLD